MKVVVIFLVLLFVLNCSLAVKNEQYARFYRFDICKEAPDSPIKWEYNTIDNSNPKYTSINAKCEIFREVKTVQIAAVVTRCAKKDALDTCEPYTTVKPFNTCEFISMKSMTWTTYIRSFEPPFICPFKTGVYVQTNGTLDPNIFHFFPIHGWYWIVEFEIYEGKKLLFTYCSEFNVIKLNK
ncbi:hypothetical protein CBL_06957 [Carabus blaptoides fortunei]